MTANNKIPALRFKEFEGEWEEKKLGDVISFLAGYAFDSNSMSVAPQKYQLIKMANVYQSVLRLDRNPSYWETIYDTQKRFLLAKGDTVLTLTGTVGKRDYGYSVIIKEENKFLLNQRLVRLRGIKDKTNNDFISILITTERFLYHFFENSKGGTGNQSNVSIEELKIITLSIPAIQEQQKIAAFLTGVDNKIQQLTKKKALLEQYKKGVMQQIFNQQIRFKDDDRNDYSDWEEKLVKDFAPLQRGFDLLVDMVVTGEYPVVFSNGILKKHNEFKAKAPGVVTGRSGTIGKVFFVEDDYWPHNTSLWVTDFKGNSEKYVYYFYSDFKLVRFGTGSGVPTLNRNDIHVQSVAVPPFEEQQKIANFLTGIDNKINAVARQLQQTQVYKKGLLQQMFV